jgi:hypothetical protein
MRPREIIEEELKAQSPAVRDKIEITEENALRCMVAQNNTQIIVAELLLDIRDLLKEAINK